MEPETQAKSYYEFFDTVSTVISYKGDSTAEFEANCDAVSRLLGEYHRLFDIYHEYAGANNLMTVNKNAGLEPVKVDEKLIDFLLYCKEIFTLTNGKTNVAMGSVLGLWHDERELGTENPEKAKLPSADALAEASKHTDINAIVIDKEASTVFISDPKVRIDVGAIGKGYATEKAAELLIEGGVTSYVLNIGGNIRAIGAKPNGDGWKTGITNPDKASTEPFVCRVNIKDISLVTSGDYERFYT
ncbi:MAG: FAD:protein FMN transferase, partial [Clostridia bacterium]|nr:FAD:protein FMN transferase [Clostridia bacterium]